VHPKYKLNLENFLSSLPLETVGTLFHSYLLFPIIRLASSVLERGGVMTSDYEPFFPPAATLRDGHLGRRSRPLCGRKRNLFSIFVAAVLSSFPVFQLVSKAWIRMPQAEREPQALLALVGFRSPLKSFSVEKCIATCLLDDTVLIGVPPVSSLFNVQHDIQCQMKIGSQTNCGRRLYCHGDTKSKRRRIHIDRAAREA
jgi:hypothetical protein